MSKTTAADLEQASALRIAVTKQNWKNGGVLVMDTDEADNLIAAALAAARAEERERCAAIPTQDALNCYHEMIESTEPGRSHWRGMMNRYQHLAERIRARGTP